MNAIIRIGAMAADHELLNKPAPMRETEAERTRRIIATALKRLVNAGLLTVPDDIAERLEQPIPLDAGP